MTVQKKFSYDGVEDKECYDEQEDDEWYDGQPGPTRHNVDEFDDVFSAYLDARKRMNEIRLVWFFLPPRRPWP